MTVQELLNDGLQRHNRGDFAGAETAGQQVLRADPANADALALLAAVYLATNRAELSRSAAERWASQRPADAAAHFAVGNARLSLNQLDAAEESLRQALRLRPVDAQIHNNLGLLYMARQELELSIFFLREAVRLNPGDAEFLANLGAALDESGRPAEAIPVLDQSLRLRPDHPGANWNRVMAALRNGDYARGWGGFEWWRSLPGAPKESFDKPRWDGSPLNGRTILIHEWMGHGDIIQFIRYALLVKKTGGRVIFQSPASLIPLLKTCAGIDELIPRNAPLPAYDVQAQLLSVPGLIRTTLATIPADIPYLSADAKLVEQWRPRLDAGALRVGIHWRGNLLTHYKSRREIPVSALARLADVPGARFYSLQKDETSPSTSITAFPELDQQGGAFMDTAAIIQNLHVVVTNDTSIAHLAGALGARVWVLLPRSSDYRWMLDRDDSPWYPTMRLFRQSRPGDWTPVIERIAIELRRWTESRASGSVSVGVTPGELLDRLTILRLKIAHATDPARRKQLAQSLAELETAKRDGVRQSENLSKLESELAAVNQRLWDLEDRVRVLEKAGDFGADFVEVARSIHRENDRRISIKSAISGLSRGAAADEKIYATGR